MGLEDAAHWRSACRSSRAQIELLAGYSLIRRAALHILVAGAVVLLRGDINDAHLGRRCGVRVDGAGDIQHQLRELADREIVGRVADVVNVTRCHPHCGWQMIFNRQSMPSEI